MLLKGSPKRFPSQVSTHSWATKSSIYFVRVFSFFPVPYFASKPPSLSRRRATSQLSQPPGHGGRVRRRGRFGSVSTRLRIPPRGSQSCLPGSAVGRGGCRAGAGLAWPGEWADAGDEGLRHLGGTWGQGPPEGPGGRGNPVAAFVGWSKWLLACISHFRSEWHIFVSTPCDVVCAYGLVVLLCTQLCAGVYCGSNHNFFYPETKMGQNG